MEDKYTIELSRRDITRIKLALYTRAVQCDILAHEQAEKFKVSGTMYEETRDEYYELCDRLCAVLNDVKGGVDNG